MKKEQKIHTCKQALNLEEIKSGVNRNPDCQACEWLIGDWKK